MKDNKNTVNINPDKLYTVTAYANLNKMHRQQVYRMIDNGKLKVVEMNGVKLVHD